MNIKDLNNAKTISQPKNVKDLSGFTVVSDYNPNALKDTESAAAYKALFPAKTGGNGVVWYWEGCGQSSGLYLNTVSSLLKLGGQALLYDNPVSKMLNIGQDKSILNAISKTAGGGIAKLAGTTEDFMADEKAYFDMFRGEMAKRFGTVEGYKQLGEELLKGKLAQGIDGNTAAQETLNTLQRTFINDPFGAGVDVSGAIAGSAGAVGRAGKIKTATSKIAEIAKAPVEDAITIAKTGGAAAKNKITDVLTPMEKGTENILANTSIEKWNNYLNQAKMSATDYHLPTALEKAGDVGADALTKIKDTMDEVYKIKNNVTNSIADKSVGNIVDKSLYKFRNLLADRVGAGITSNGEIVQLGDRALTITKKSDFTLLNLAYGKLRALAENPTFKRVDDTIDALQAILYESKKVGVNPINKKVEGLLKSVVGELNEELKIIGGAEYRGANSYLAEARSVYDKLNKMLGDDVSKGGSLMKRVFSPTDGGTKKIFEKVRAITGIDLIEEATLAKLAMEISGDARQASLLEQLNLLAKPQSTQSLILEAGKKILDKLKNTEQKAKNIINRKKKNKINLKTPKALQSDKQPGLSIKDISRVYILKDKNGKVVMKVNIGDESSSAYWIDYAKRKGLDLEQDLSKVKISDFEQIIGEAGKFDDAEQLYQRANSNLRDRLKDNGVYYKSQYEKFWNENIGKKEKILDSLNPTGGALVDYTPKERATMKLAENITTLDVTSQKPPSTIITIYRGAPKNQKSILPGDFITTNYDLAASYTGDGNIISKKVKMSDILDDMENPLGEEYIYRPK